MLPLRQAMPKALADLVRAAPLSTGKLEFAWQLAVGPRLQRNTSIRLEANGLLIVDAASRQWSNEIRRSSALIVLRLQALLGDAIVTRLEVRDR
jgi:hypothetical protein